MCFVGSVVIVLHAPPDKEVETVDQILQYAIQPGQSSRKHEPGPKTNKSPGFLLYCTLVAVFAFVMIYHISPKYGKKNPLIYLSICSSVGSISVMSIKAFGVALKLTLRGHNQFTHPSTYVFIIVVVVCILTQMNYFNKALSQFSTNMYVSLPLSIQRSASANKCIQRQPAVLRNFHNRDHHCVVCPVRRLQYHRRRQHHLSTLRVPRHLHWRVPSQPIAPGP